VAHREYVEPKRRAASYGNAVSTGWMGA